jgi:hypothetical protein
MNPNLLLSRAAYLRRAAEDNALHQAPCDTWDGTHLSSTLLLVVTSKEGRV